MVIQDGKIVLPTPEELDKIVSVENHIDYTEYPSADLVFMGIDPGEGFSYVSDSYLNGLVNFHDQIVGGFMIRRYTGSKDIVLYGKDEGEGLDEWKESCDYIDYKAAGEHSNYRNCRDDVFLLTKIDSYELPTYVFFWSDQDCSDCCIGRFYCDKYKTDDDAMDGLFKYALEAVFAEMSLVPERYYKHYVFEHPERINSLLKYIPPRCFNGWITL